MSQARVWGTSVKGNVYTLGTSTSEWVQVRNQQNVLQGFKKVIASPMGAWALGCDHQVYIYVEKSDVPIRCQVSTYENERWLPTQGWGQKNLLPAVDPFDWSSEDGHVHLPREDFRLTSRSWEWEGEWRVDHNVQGFSTDQEGWRYSHIGFHSGFTHKKTFRSCVRRRKWIRYQRYMAADHWSKLASIHIDPLEEPIVDVTIGGYNLPNLEEGAASVWIVTIDGKTVFRSGVSQKSPEGTSWLFIPLDEEDPDIVSISAGSTHLVWVVTFQGAILARTGVTWQNIKGSEWVQVPVPEGLGDKDRIVQVSVGHSTAWVVSSEGKVWFRKGISEENPHGTGWLQMVDRMKMTAVIGQDKVIGIDMEDRQLYYRLGMSLEEASGRSWQLVDLPFTSMTSHPSGSVSSEMSSYTDEGIDTSSIAASERETGSESQECSGKTLTDDSSAKSAVPETREVLQGGVPKTGCDVEIVKASKEDTKIPVIAGVTATADVSYCKENEESSVSGSNRTSASNLSGVRKSTSDQDQFLSMGLNDDFSGLELNLEVDDEQDIGGSGRGGFGHLTINMDEDVTQDESVYHAQDTAAGDGSEKVQKGPGVGDTPSIVWDESVAGKDDKQASEQQKYKFVGFNRLRTNFGNRLKSPVEMINRLKTTSPKQMLKDLKHDIRDGKKEVLSVLTQAQEVFRHGKQEQEGDRIKVSFRKEGEIGEEENLELKFYEEAKTNGKDAVEGSEPIDRGCVGKRSNQDCDVVSTSLSIGPTPSLSTQTSSVFGDDPDDSHMDVLYVPAERDIGDIQWAWVSGCFKQDLDEAKLKHWFYNDKDNQMKMIYQRQVSKSSWRDVILKNLRDLAGAMNKYKYPQAIENTGWCKTGTMKWWQDIHRGHKWLKCKVDLSQDEDKSCSSLTIHYTWKSKQQLLFVDLKDVVCIRCDKEDTPGSHSFSVFTTDRQTASPAVGPIRLCTDQEQSMEDWVSALCLTLCEVHGTLGKPHPQSMWSLTDRSDIFVHEPSTEMSAQTSTMLWRHFGGHLNRVESNCLGITWGLANNGTAYVYSGGYGGGFFKGVASSPYGIHIMVDTHNLYIYENQRWRLGKGYTNKAKLVRHYMWSDETGRKELTKDTVKLASCRSAWITDWTVDYRAPGGVDKEGWQYASGKSFHRKFYPRPKINSYLRRRRWSRKYKVSTTGPWEEVGPLRLVDVSVQPDPFQTGLDQPVAVWAVGESGELLCREGVTLTNFKGTSWVHIPSDQVFSSVSIAMDLLVWAVSKDGGVWVRQGVSPKDIAGTSWVHVSPPLHTHLRQVSAGASGVWIVDNSGNLWCRTGMSQCGAIGSGWAKIKSNIRQVSAGLLDQVWTIIDETDTSMGPVHGIVARYTKCSSDDPTAGTWETGIGGGWKYVSARGQMI